MASRSLLRAALLLGMTASVVASVEVGVRLLGIAPPLQRQYPRMVADPHLPFRPPSNASYLMSGVDGEFEDEVHTNSAGFRDSEHFIQKPPGVFRILGLGDSFTFGVGASFEDTYLTRLERMLNQRPGDHPRIEIIKAGTLRFYPETERMLLESYGMAYEPDLVVVGFTPNDVSDTAFGVDALPRFRAADGHEKLFWDRDPHCTPAGYRLLAEALFDGLESTGLVP